MNTTSKLDLTSTQVRQSRRAQQVLESRPMSLDELPQQLLQQLPTDANHRAQRVLQSQRASLQRSLF